MFGGGASVPFQSFGVMLLIVFIVGIIAGTWACGATMRVPLLAAAARNDETVVGCWLLVVGCWLLVVGCWLLVVGRSGWAPLGSWTLVGVLPQDPYTQPSEN